jgi:phytoene synthase
MHAVFGIDAAMGDVVRGTREAQLGPIRLAWWRERLEALDTEAAAPPEPRLRAVERELLPRGIGGTDVAALETGWLRLFEPFPWTIETSEAIWFRGNLLFGISAKILGETNERVQSAGGLWVLVDTARHCSDPQSREMLLSQARKFAKTLAGVRFPSALRPLSMLAVLAARDVRRGEPFEPEGTPARAWALLRHRLSGRFPRQS